jgi:hypothetical protein
VRESSRAFIFRGANRAGAAIYGIASVLAVSVVVFPLKKIAKTSPQLSVQILMTSIDDPVNRSRSSTGCWAVKLVKVTLI